MNARELTEALEKVARHLLGEPGKRLSTRKDLRYGTHGSLSVNVVKGTWFDHEAGEGGAVLDLIKRERDLVGADAFKFIRDECGVDLDDGADRGEFAHVRKNNPDPRSSFTDNHKAAFAIWNESQPAQNTIVEIHYLCARCITIAPPPSIRYHPALKHSPTGLMLPAMVAGVQGDGGKVVAIHRTYLDLEGSKAAVSSPKMALGPIAGGAVRLAPASETLTLTEGIEDGLALVQMTGRAVWAVLGTSGFKNAVLPLTVRTVVLAPDADPAGDAAVAKAAARFADMGLKVLHLRPPEARDFCDVLADFEERAGIREYDGGQDRTEAEFAAFAEVIGGSLAHA